MGDVFALVLATAGGMAIGFVAGHAMWLRGITVAKRDRWGGRG